MYKAISSGFLTPFISGRGPLCMAWYIHNPWNYELTPKKMAGRIVFQPSVFHIWSIFPHLSGEGC